MGLKAFRVQGCIAGSKEHSGGPSAHSRCALSSLAWPRTAPLLPGTFPFPPGDNIMTLIINGWEYRMYTADASMRKDYDGAQSYCKGLGYGWDLVPYNDNNGYGECGQQPQWCLGPKDSLSRAGDAHARGRCPGQTGTIPPDRYWYLEAQCARRGSPVRHVPRCCPRTTSNTQAHRHLRLPLPSPCSRRHCQEAVLCQPVHVLAGRQGRRQVPPHRSRRLPAQAGLRAAGALRVPQEGVLREEQLRHVFLCVNLCVLHGNCSAVNNGLVFIL